MNLSSVFWGVLYWLNLVRLIFLTIFLNISISTACLAYEDSGELPATSSEALHNIMRCVFKRELYQCSRTLHDQNYDSILITIGQKCLYNLVRGRSYLRNEDVSGFARKYCSTIMGFLVQNQVMRVNQNRIKVKNTSFLAASQ